MNATDHANLSSSIKLMKDLEELITTKARSIFSPELPDSHVFDVVISKTRDEYEARLIAYMGDPDTPHAEWMLLLVNQRLCESPVDALADLLEGVYERAGLLIGSNDVGRIYSGKWEG